ncbi:MAG TPA: hypothetical protein PL155_03575 [Candidatus Omnitrophota bacterium]|nr:hypothetical protein [Candidatus Omnitrophota bacterium]HPD84441.1 hypothetical protein [Candidatus Omnitrophota bacterium]HRZ03299.1 hypothetical protein [Candidatus Omnitrophota bacterium]
MNRIARICSLSIAFLWLSLTAHAETSQTIRLKDGSTLKGTVVGFQNGAYSVKTTHLGTVDIPSSDVVRITTDDAADPEPSKAQDKTQPESLPDKTQVKEKIDAIQQKVTSDPKIMSEIQDAAQDKEIIELLKDPDILGDVLSYDPKRIESNPKIQALIKNPKIQNLMNEIYQKTGNPSP